MIKLLLPLLALPVLAAEPALRLSVYATAGDVQRYLATPEGRERAGNALRRLGVSRIFLEGRRGDEYVPPDVLRGLRQYFAARGFETAGGIATVPGKTFGVRQNGTLGWLNWESPKTREEIAGFFREDAAVFDELIVDDFYCTGDTSPASEKARGSRAWSEYRQDLLTGLIDSMIVEPARAARPPVRLILKYPQWYDRFQLFGYAPARMSPKFDRIWVGTEVRNPLTRRMGYVQPTEGYMNFRWLSAVAGPKVQGAWFDHIECTAQNFVDQAWQSVLAGARELTLFHLGDVVEGHPGHALLEAALPDLTALAAKIRQQAPRGIAYYKPPGSDGDENLYLMDYLGMIGLPVVPAARYPSEARAAILGVQAAADPELLQKMRRHLANGATVILTPALLRKAGAEARQLAGVRVGAEAQPGLAGEVEFGNRKLPLSVPLEIDRGVTAADGVEIAALVQGTRVPLLISRASGRGRVLVWNTRTFSEQDFRDSGEWLLAPKPLGLPEIPRELADELRRYLLAPLGLRFAAPTRIGLYLPGGNRCFYNFRGEDTEVNLNGQAIRIGANRLVCR